MLPWAPLPPADETLWWDDVITHHRLLAPIQGGSQNKTFDWFGLTPHSRTQRGSDVAGGGFPTPTVDIYPPPIFSSELRTAVRAATPQSDWARRGLLRLLHKGCWCPAAACDGEADESLSVLLEDLSIIQVQVWPCVPVWSGPGLDTQTADSKGESRDEGSSCRNRWCQELRI